MYWEHINKNKQWMMTAEFQSISSQLFAIDYFPGINNLKFCGFKGMTRFYVHKNTNFSSSNPLCLSSLVHSNTHLNVVVVNAFVSKNKKEHDFVVIRHNRNNTSLIKQMA